MELRSEVEAMTVPSAPTASLNAQSVVGSTPRATPGTIRR